MPDCFIIMPITTPELFVPHYSGDKQHFHHVLEHLFIPALEKNKFNPIPPIAEGSDVIHAEIIKNLEKADLVLCDASCLNPNVFYELGIRTALDKPVCIVKDEITQKIPFDTTIINHHTYESSLDVWALEKQINDLAEHIKKSVQRSAGKNTLWKYFGLSTRATLPQGNESKDDKIELLTLQVEGLIRKMDEVKAAPSERLQSTSAGKIRILEDLFDIGTALGLPIVSVERMGDKKLMIVLKQSAKPKEVEPLVSICTRLGYSVMFQNSLID